jgi:hypothetical protein
MKFSWSVQWPFWKYAAALGVPILVQAILEYDKEANIWLATNESIGLNLEAETIELLIQECHLAVPGLLEIAHTNSTKAVVQHVYRQPAFA